MSQARIGNAEVLTAEGPDLPLVGVWTAEVELGTGDGLPAVGEAVRLEVLSAAGVGVAYQGTVRTSGEYEGRARLFIVGGAGGLGETVAAKPYANSPTALHLVTDLVRDAGEVLSATVDADALSERSVNTWLRAEGTGATGLQRIAEHFGYSWRVLRDGSVWVGSETWPAYSGADPYELEQDRAADCGTYADGEELVPGETREGRKVYRVVHSVRADGTRARVTYDRSERDEFRAAVRGAIPELLYLSSYEARVVGQNADGTVEVIAYDPRIGGLSKVPIRYGAPGISADVSFGARLRVAFEAADPSSYYATEWIKSAAATKLRFDGLTGYANQAVARVSDVVDVVEVLWDATTFTLWIACPGVVPPALGGAHIYTKAIVIPGGSVVGIAANPNTPAPPIAGTVGTTLPGVITTGLAALRG